MGFLAMFFPLVVLVLAAFAAALPISYGPAAAYVTSPPYANATGLWWEPSANDIMTCDRASYDDDAELDAANWRQCAALYSSLAGQNGIFHVSDGNTTAGIPLLSHRDCTLSVTPLDTNKGPYAIGSTDIRTILGDSLKNFSRGTLLSVKGVVKCTVAGGGKARLSWQIAKSAE